MGYSRWSDDAYSHLSRDYASKSADDIFSKAVKVDMLPKDLKAEIQSDS